jgi:topoisomerase-4 subunit A
MVDQKDLENPENQENQNYTELNGQEGDNLPKSLQLSGMYKNWFLDYASYVILERAVPHINDGLKPVQRRLLHAMKDLDDGRFNKVANIIGHTMKYHPHGDRSIGDALVQLGQKDLLVETQGNWGNIFTGDDAAAPRYIEARLSKFALEVMFNPKTTTWISSYDGRNKEPLTLPAKFPLLLAQDIEGIAVGLTSKILPHNFIELIDASIDYLKGKETELLPDFPTGGMADVSRYNDGSRGSRVRIRAKITAPDKKTLIISEIPFGTNTRSLIESIIAANDRGKIRIRKIEDNTAENVEIVVHLAPGVSPDQSIDALYAFTQCEITVSPVLCVIEDKKPRFTSVKEILALSTENTRSLLKLELEIQKAEALEHLHFCSLEKLFIEKEIYEDIKKCKTDEDIDKTIEKGFKPYLKQLIRPIIPDDIKRLRKIHIERISKFNSLKADEVMKSIEDDIKQINHDLKHITEFTIEYFKRIRKKYGPGRERKTELKNFDVIQATMVAAATQKLYVNREEGFAGTSLKKDEFVSDCSDIDDIIVFREDGTCLVTKVTDKVFVGQGIIHIDVFRKNDERTIYNMAYRDGRIGGTMVKRFAVIGVTRDKEYDLTKGTKDSKVLYFTANPNGEAEIVTVNLRPKPRLRVLTFDFDFSTLAIKGRSSQGNILSRNEVRKITLKDTGISTLGARDIWFDEAILRLNADGRGIHLGAFSDDEKIIAFMKSGNYKIYNYDLSNHFDDDVIIIEKYKPTKVYTAVYFDAEAGFQFVKRFQAEATDKKVLFISEGEGSELIHITGDKHPRIEVIYNTKNTKAKPQEEFLLEEFIGVKGYKAKGKRLANNPVKKINILESIHLEGDDVEEAQEEMETDIPETEETTVEEITEPEIISKKKEKKVKEVKEKEEEGEEAIVFEEEIIPVAPIKKVKKATVVTEKEPKEKSKKKPDKKDGSNKPSGKQIELEF